jgi:tRNA isopentenyl-2-thiomethyl-A-37 hydroxylase MiaE
VTEHWCLAHYLLDGYHKTYAASLARKSITLLSFLALAESVATEENIDKTLEVLAAQEKVS